MFFFLAIAAAIIGTGVKIAGSIIESAEEEKARELKEEQATEEGAYLAEAAEFAALKAETMAGQFEEEAGLVKKETAAKVGEMGLSGAEQLASQKATTFARGLEGGSSYEAVRSRFEKRLGVQIGLTSERGTLSAQRLLTQASLTRGGSEVEQQRYELQIAGLGRQIEMLDYQESIAPWKLGLNIAGDIASGGMSLATSGVKPPGSSDIHPMSTGWL